MLPLATYIGGDLKKLGWATFKGSNYDREGLLSALVSGDKYEATNNWWSTIGDDVNRKYIKCAPKDNLEPTKIKKKFLKRVETLKNHYITV